MALNVMKSKQKVPMKINNIVEIPSHNLRAFASVGAKILVYKTDGSNKPINIIQNEFYHGEFVKMLRLFEDVLCCDDGGTLVTRRARSGEVLASSFVLCDKKKITIFKHTKGRNIKAVRTIAVEDIFEISCIAGYGRTVVAIGICGKSEVWDCADGRIACFKVAEKLSLVKVSVDYIACGGSNDGIMHIYRNGRNCELFKSVNLKEYFRQKGRKSRRVAQILDITIINSTLIMVVYCLGIVFVSLPSRGIVSGHEFGKGKYTTCATILPDGRIYAAGTDPRDTAGTLVHIFQAPDFIKEEVEIFAADLYKESKRARVEVVSGCRKRVRYEDEEIKLELQAMKKDMNDADVSIDKTMVELIGQREALKKEKLRLEEEGREIEDTNADLESEKRELRSIELKQEEQAKKMAKLWSKQGALKQKEDENNLERERLEKKKKENEAVKEENSKMGKENSAQREIQKDRMKHMRSLYAEIKKRRR